MDGMKFTKIESCMLFGYFEKTKVFEIENSGLHRKAGTGISTVEFLQLHRGENHSLLRFVEAKSSIPRKETSRECYEEFIEEITDKFIHSFNMYAADKLGIYDEIDGEIAEISDGELKYRFVLVINTHEAKGFDAAFLEGVCNDLEKRLRERLGGYFFKIWRFDEGTARSKKAKVLVFDERIAKERQLVAAYATVNKSEYTAEYSESCKPEEQEQLKLAVHEYIERIRNPQINPSTP